MYTINGKYLKRNIIETYDETTQDNMIISNSLKIGEQSDSKYTLNVSRGNIVANKDLKSYASMQILSDDPTVTDNLTISNYGIFDANKITVNNDISIGINDDDTKIDANSINTKDINSDKIANENEIDTKIINVSEVLNLGNVTVYPSNPRAGDLIHTGAYDTNDFAIEVYDGLNWRKLMIMPYTPPET